MRGFRGLGCFHTRFLGEKSQCEDFTKCRLPFGKEMGNKMNLLLSIFFRLWANAALLLCSWPLTSLASTLAPQVTS